MSLLFPHILTPVLITYRLSMTYRLLITFMRLNHNNTQTFISIIHSYIFVYICIMTNIDTSYILKALSFVIGIKIITTLLHKSLLFLIIQDEFNYAKKHSRHIKSL